MFSRVFKAFEYPDFRRMWIGACTSSVGTWMQKLAQSWLVYDLTNSAFMLGVDTFLGEIPIFLFSLLGGVAADRMDRRKLLLASQFVQLTCAFTLAILLILKLVRVEYIFFLSFTVGCAQAFGGPAYQSIIPSLVPKDGLQNAIALNSIQFNLARVIGPAIGGVAMNQFGAAWCFIINGLSFVAVIYSLIRLPARLPVGAKKESPLESLKGGIEFVKSREAMMPLIVLAFLMTFFGVPLLTFLPVIAREVLQLGSTAFSVFLSVSGVGSVTGALIVAGLSNVKEKGRPALILLAAFGLLTIGFSQSNSFWLSCTLLYLCGAVLMGVFALVMSLVQTITPDEMRGRVMSVYNVAFRGGMPFGNLVSGQLMQTFHAPPILAANGAMLIVVAAYFFFVQRKIVRA